MSPRSPGRWVFASLVTVLVLAIVVRLSASPVSTGNRHSSLLRLSWSARPERIETCRVLSKEELEKLEQHMRQRVQCEGRFATYELSVFVGDKLDHQSIVRGAGLRNDRPIYLLRDIEVPPGSQHVRISFVRREKSERESTHLDSDSDQAEDSGIFRGRAEREREERERRARAAIPPRLAFDSVLSFSPGKVSIVTLDAERGSLVLLGRD